MNLPTGRQSWLDGDTPTSLIDQYVQKLNTFMEAMADGRIDAAELQAQEQRMVAAMKATESSLDDATHAKVTRLLCELSAYNIMQTLSLLQEARPATTFRG